MSADRFEEPLIQVRDLKKCFGSNTVLEGVTVDIYKGDVVCVIGASGSGKSTFLRCLNLLEEPTGGQILFEGADITDKKSDINMHRQKMGMVFQQFNLFPHMTVMENLTLAPIKLQGKKKDEIEAEALALLDRVGLKDRADSYPSQLSGGQKQRIAIARVFLKDPAILILDEATSALDNATELMIQQALDELCRGRTTLIVAHRLSTIQGADKIVVLTEEGIQEEGSHRELLEQDGLYARLYNSQFAAQR